MLLCSQTCRHASWHSAPSRPKSQAQDKIKPVCPKLNEFGDIRAIHARVWSYEEATINWLSSCLGLVQQGTQNFVKFRKLVDRANKFSPDHSRERMLEWKIFPKCANWLASPREALRHFLVFLVEEASWFTHSANLWAEPTSRRYSWGELCRNTILGSSTRKNTTSRYSPDWWASVHECPTNLSNSRLNMPDHRKS